MSLSTSKALNPATLAITASVQDQGHWVRAMCLGSGGRLYAASGKSVSVWSCKDLTPVARLETKPGAIRALAVTEKYIITGTHNQNIHAYDIETHKHALKLVGHVGAITWLLPSPGGKVRCNLADSDCRAVRRALCVFHVYMSSFLFFLSPQYLFSASLDGRIKVWDLKKELVLQTLHRHSDSINVLVRCWGRRCLSPRALAGARAHSRRSVPCSSLVLARHKARLRWRRRRGENISLDRPGANADGHLNV